VGRRTQQVRFGPNLRGNPKRSFSH